MQRHGVNSLTRFSPFRHIFEWFFYLFGCCSRRSRSASSEMCARAACVKSYSRIKINRFETISFFFLFVLLLGAECARFFVRFNEKVLQHIRKPIKMGKIVCAPNTTCGRQNAYETKWNGMRERKENRNRVKFARTLQLRIATGNF